LKRRSRRKLDGSGGYAKGRLHDMVKRVVEGVV